MNRSNPDMNNEINTTSFILEESLGMSERRKNLVTNLPFPMGALYKNLLIKTGLEEQVSFFEITKLSAALLKYLSAVAISDYLGYFEEKKWSSPEINRAILDYFAAPNEKNAHKTTKLILTGFKENEFMPVVPGFLRLLEKCPANTELPDFIKVRGSLLDTFLFFFHLENEMTSGRFFLVEPSKEIVSGYFLLMEHILFQLYSIFNYPVFIPVRGMPFNCWAIEGPSIRHQKIAFSGEDEFTDKYHFKAILHLSDQKFMELHPFLYLQDASGGKGVSIGNLLFLHRASEAGYSYIDYHAGREIPISQLDKKLRPRIESFLKKLQAEAPMEKREKRQPLVSFKEFIEFHSRFFVGRENLIEEIDEHIKNNNQVYALLTGNEGHGKTALLCHYINTHKETPVIYHFVRKIADLDKPIVILRSLIAQLMHIKGTLDIAWEDIPYRIADLVEMFRDKLEDTAKFCRKNKEKLVFIIDSVDEIPYLRETLEIIPENLPDNVVGILSLEAPDGTQDIGIDLHIKPEYIRSFKNCPMESLSREEITILLNKTGLGLTQSQKPDLLVEKIFWATQCGQPLIVRLVINSILSAQLNFNTILSLPDKPESMNIGEWYAFLEDDDFYRTDFLETLYGPTQPDDTGDQVLLYDILGALLLFQHTVSDDDLARAFRCDIFRIMENRRRLNKFLILEEGRYSFSNHRIMDYIRPLYSIRDLIRIHAKIIDYYEVRKPAIEGGTLESHVISLNALRYLPLHYYLTGRLSNDYQLLFDLLSDDHFRMDQGLRLSMKDMLESLELAINVAVEKNDIKNLIKFGFLYDDIKNRGIKGGLSLIVSQAEEGNFKEAIEMTRKIQDESFKFRQMLFIVWMLAHNNDFLKTMEFLDEALMMPGSTFHKEDEDFVFAVVEEVIGIGIAEGLDLLTSGVDETRIVSNYSRLSNILSSYPDLILNVVTSAAMQLRKISSEELKSKFILEFARINNQLDDEIKKRQFFENFIYEAKNLEDEQIRYKALADLAVIFINVDKARCDDILRDALLDIENMGLLSPMRFKLEAYYAGLIARMGDEEWASKLFKNAMEASYSLPIESERADVFQEIAGSLIHLKNSATRADYLEQLFSRADSFENISNQAKVMVGISEVLSDADDDLLNIYFETFKYIDELPVDTAMEAMSKISSNLKIVKDEEWFTQILTSFTGIIEYLRSPEEKAELFIPVGQGLCYAGAFGPDTHFAYMNGFIDLTSEISGYDSEEHRGKALGKIAASIIDAEVPGTQDLITTIIKKVSEFEDEKAKLPVYTAISENIYKFKSSDDIEWIYEYLESVIREIQSGKLKGKALMSLTRGITRIKSRALRDRLIDAVITITENLEGKLQSYRILSSITGGLINAGEKEEGIVLYKRALSQIPVKEEKAPDALGGVMAGLCRGIAAFATQEWAREIYKRLLNRLDFIAPERKKLEVLEGIIDGLKALENKDLMRKYFMELGKIVHRFINPREKTLGFIRLAQSFQEIGDKDESRRMWERLITSATILDEEENGGLKASKLSEALIYVWRMGDTEWIEQAVALITDCAGKMSMKILPRFIEDTFRDIEKLPNQEIQRRMLELLISLIEKPEDSDDWVICMAAASRGIGSIGNIGLLQQILEQLVKSVKKVKKGISRVRAMAILAKNFLDVGLGEWAKQSYDRIKKAYQKLKESNIRAQALSEMIRIPFASKEEEWQNEIYEEVMNNELPNFDGDSRGMILEAVITTLAGSNRVEWALTNIDTILKQSMDFDHKLAEKIYHALFQGFAEVGNIDSIFRYRNTIKNRLAWEISAQYIKEALLKLLKNDVMASFRYFERITDRKLKVELVPDFFDNLMLHRHDFDGNEFLYQYHNLLSLAIYDRDSLDFVIGKVVSYYQDEESLVEIAEALGVIEREKAKIAPTKLLKATMIPEEMKPGEDEELDEPLDLVADAAEIATSADSGTSTDIKDESAEDASATGFLHSRSTILKKTMPVGPVPEVGNIAEYLKNGYNLTRAHYFSEARKYFQKAIELYPTDPRGYIGMGATYYILRDYRQAAEFYIKAVEAKPELDHLERFLKAVPRNAYLWFRFAKNLFLLKQYNETIKLCDRVKAEGVYFDFVKKVDALKAEAQEKKEGFIAVPRGKNRWAIVIGAALLFLIISITSAGPWYYYINGNKSLEEAEKRIQAYAEGKNYNEEAEFEEYSLNFKKAIAFYERIKRPTTFFNKKQFFDTRMKLARCKYAIGHYPVLNYQWGITEKPPSDKGAEALSFREQAEDDYKRLLMDEPENPTVLFYLGLCKLDSAVITPGTDNLPRPKRKDCFVDAINYLIKSTNKSDPGSDSAHESHLMLAVAKINYYLYFKDKQTTKLAKTAIKDLENASPSEEDPRAEVYKLAVYAITKNKSRTIQTFGLAKNLIDSQYEYEPRKKQYWTKLAIKFRGFLLK